MSIRCDYSFYVKNEAVYRRYRRAVKAMVEARVAAATEKAGSDNTDAIATARQVAEWAAGCITNGPDHVHVASTEGCYLRGEHLEDLKDCIAAAGLAPDEYKLVWSHEVWGEGVDGTLKPNLDAPPQRHPRWQLIYFDRSHWTHDVDDVDTLGYDDYYHSVKVVAVEIRKGRGPRRRRVTWFETPVVNSDSESSFPSVIRDRARKVDRLPDRQKWRVWHPDKWEIEDFNKAWKEVRHG